MAKLATGSNLRKAHIQVLDANGAAKEEIPVLFNPSEYSLEKSNEFANINIPGLESPLLQFVRGGLETLSMDLFFDSYEENKDVRGYTDRITDLLRIDPTLHAPPILRFIWASLNFTCVLARATKRFTMFRSDGIPVRATLGVTFNEYQTATTGKEKPLESRDRTKRYILKEGDSLWQISAEEYGEPGLWRAIAEANDIDNPRILEIGKEIVIPPLE
jgi:nucleoid-associated protein YgaU